MLKLTDVSKSFGNLQVLQPTSIEFQTGQTSILLGTSGCGKSTLLRLMIGLINPDSGTIHFNDQVVEPKNIEEIRHRIGYMIQDGGLFPHLSVRDNVSLLAVHLGWEKSKVDQRLNELLTLVHLPSEALDRFPGQISGGQRQRVALMRALFLDPDVLLLDEPMGALDPIIRSDLQNELREIFRSLNKTVIVVTHDIGEAAFLGDSISILKAGEILQSGTFEDLLRRPKDPFVTEFINAKRNPLQDLAEVKR
ncbi:MAG: ATP-binding cassette domain-containing protein [Planctomicrobium sp.]|jgi:osmoprotectant transport system ATP-binding protein|nr:ATP-binding cassette domain-containing protein [Planctomicrobium sp.]